MNFFEHQARARSLSRRLSLWFALSVLAVVAAVDGLVLLVLGVFGTEPGQPPPFDPVMLVAVTSVVVLLVIGIGSLYKIATLASGGAAVARSLGAAPLPSSSVDPAFRRLRNVVEEMAIASGVPVPQIFVLEGEAGINAFAAGYAPTDAAVTVTRGALDKLSRDELQGVIAHEFSHVLNGDMRLNIRLLGLLHGLLVLALIAGKVLEHGPRSSGSSRGGGAIMAIALGVFVLGYIGLFFGRLIKAGVSRSRELLADASAVQFTRQSAGLAGALKKAAGLSAGTRLSGAGGEEVAHMLFGDGVGLRGLFATHPPLAERIRRLDPSFRPEQLKTLATAWNAPGYRADDEQPPRTLGLVQATGVALRPAAVVAHVGHPEAADWAAARALRQSLPTAWVQAMDEPATATQAVLALALDDDESRATAQLADIERRWGPAMAESLRTGRTQLPPLQRVQKLPLLSLALPALRRMPRGRIERLIASVDALIRADARIEVFEYALIRLLREQLGEAMTPRETRPSGSLKLEAAEDAICTLLAVLAQQGHRDAAAAQLSYLLGLQQVLPRCAQRYAPPADWAPALDLALRRLDAMQPAAKSLLLEALVLLLGADGRVTVDEAELLRVICAALHLPLPPLIEDAA